MSVHSETAFSVRDLRRRWKPYKLRLLENGGEQPTSIRFHRACSWLDRVEKYDESEDLDLRLIGLWVGFNALYGQWNEDKREPEGDRESWRFFVDRLLGLDESNYLADALSANKRLVMTLLEDEYLSSFFWQDPCTKRAGQSRKAKYNAQGWYVEKRWTMILDETLERIYLMRCQLVHGAATYGGKLNRMSLKHCVWMLRKILTAFLLVWIDHGVDQDWGPMCYPPLKQEEDNGQHRYHVGKPR
ncbi:HEPN domain-containing protein [Pirellulaceae bacterium]|nr:HEPN domain-containing protein [Pirellulaceae bacterium]